MERTNSINIRDQLIAQAQQAKEIMVQGRYALDGRVIDIEQQQRESLQGTTLIAPADWAAILEQALQRCQGGAPAAIALHDETTLQALRRLAGVHGQGTVAALNFASARRPGGGWDTGARAQEESLARASTLIASLRGAAAYYAANRAHDHLFYTDHAIWSPSVSFFATDDGSLLAQPYLAGVITMPAPNVGGMVRLSEADLEALPGIWRHRIRCVLALAIRQGVRHLVLGAWGCGAFGNDPERVVQHFHRVLLGDEPWLRGVETVTFAIHDPSRSGRCLSAFQAVFGHSNPQQRPQAQPQLQHPHQHPRQEQQP